ncbi:MAG: tetratricopeptide repeat protein [Acidobacteria bacterium]|nr:tetratricopeptide repeat protein [Acidobacteriota bacterium]
MRKWGAVGFFAVFVFSHLAHGQSTMRLDTEPPRPRILEMQILLPGGQAPKQRIPFQVAAENGGSSSLQLTDSNGYFPLDRLIDGQPIRLTIFGDGKNYGTTIVPISPDETQNVRITLRALTGAPGTSENVLSAASPYAPDKQVTRMFQKAMKEVSENRLDSAEGHLRDVAAKDPQFAPALAELGTVLYRQKQYAESERIERKALTLDPSSALALRQLGMALNRQDRFAEAIAPLQSAVRLDPAQPLGHFHLALALDETGKTAEAAQEYQKSFAGPGEIIPAGMFFLGRLYAKSADFPKSSEMFKRFLQAAPQSPLAPEAQRMMQQIRGVATPIQ